MGILVLISRIFGHFPPNPWFSSSSKHSKNSSFSWHASWKNPQKIMFSIFSKRTPRCRHFALPNVGNASRSSENEAKTYFAFLCFPIFPTVPTDQNCHARRVASLENANSRDALVHNIAQASYELLKKILRCSNSRIFFSRNFWLLEVNFERARSWLRAPKIRA